MGRRRKQESTSQEEEEQEEQQETMNVETDDDDSEPMESESEAESDEAAEDVKEDQIEESIDNDKDQSFKPEEKVLQEKKDKRGIIYLSHIPAGLTIDKVRDLMGEYGKIGRIYLAPHRTRPRQGRIKIYTEGWIEFQKKKIAKQVASMLNGRAVGGKKHQIFRDAIWSMKYLKRFKWHHLVEQMAFEKAQRDQRLRFEVGMAKRETDFYLDMVNKSKRLARLKGKQTEDSGGPSSSSVDQHQPATYKQRRILEDRAFHSSDQQVDVDLLKKIFT